MNLPTGKKPVLLHVMELDLGGDRSRIVMIMSPLVSHSYGRAGRRTEKSIKYGPLYLEFLNFSKDNFSKISAFVDTSMSTRSLLNGEISKNVFLQ